MRTLRQASMSSPSRLVSIARLSMVRLSTPVASTAKCPPFRTEKSRSRTLRHSLRAIALLPWPSMARSAAASGSSARPDRGPHAERPVPRLSRPPGARSPPGEACPVDATRARRSPRPRARCPRSGCSASGCGRSPGRGRARSAPAGRSGPCSGAGVGREQRGARAELEGDVALQPDGVARVRARGQVHGAAPGSRRGLDGSVDRLRCRRSGRRPSRRRHARRRPARPCSRRGPGLPRARRAAEPGRHGGASSSQASPGWAILIWDDRSSLMSHAVVVPSVSTSSWNRGSGGRGADTTVDHSDIRGSSLGPAVMVVIRRELPRTIVVGRGGSPPHRISEGPPFRLAPRPPLALLQEA